MALMGYEQFRKAGWIRAEVDAQSKGCALIWKISSWSFPIHTYPSSTRALK